MRAALPDPGSQPDTPLRNSHAVEAAAVVARWLGDLPTPLRPLQILDALPDHIRALLLPVLARYFPDGDFTLLPGMSQEIHQDLLSLLDVLEMTQTDRLGHTVLTEPYRGAVRLGPERLARVLSNSRSGSLSRVRRGHAAVRKQVESVLGADGRPELARDNNELYLLHLAYYLEELSNISLHGQVSTKLPPRFYSDLGDLAFRLYTASRFRLLCGDIDYESFLDIGCGAGRHLAVAHEVRPDAEIVGIDLQADVVRQTSKELEDVQKISVIHADFLSWQPERKFDMIFACYMIFYLDHRERGKFFTRVRESLSPNGRFVLCQYFPDAPAVQRALIGAEKRLPRVQEHLSGIGQVLCYGESLLNRCLDTFRTVAYWDEVRNQIRAAGLEIESVQAADSMYYSLLLVIRPSNQHEERTV